MKNRALYFIAAIFSSCQTIVELDVPQKEQGLTVNCFFNPDSIWTANITQSQFVLDDGAIKRVNNAIIGLYEESVWIDELKWVSDGYYRSGRNYKPQTGKNYKLVVKVNGFAQAEAKDICPFPTQITKVDTGNFIMEGNKYYELNITFKDNTAEKNYYNIQLFALMYEPIFDSLWNIIDSLPLYQPLEFQSYDFVFDNEQWFDVSGAPFTDEIFSTKGEYRLNIFTDIYNKGYYDSTVVNPSYIYNEIVIALKSVSEAHYKYVASYQRYTQSNGNPFAQPVQVYNNITNGYGIFAGYSTAKYTLKLN